MSQRIKVKAANGWAYEYFLTDDGKWPNDGLILRNILHKDYNLARSIRVVGVWINPGHSDKSKVKYLRLGDEDFEGTDTSGGSLSKAPGNFRVYKIVHQHKVKFVSRERTDFEILGEGKPVLEVEQRFLFGTYGKSPAHEPGGVLPAVRFFPLIKFATKNSEIESVRFDYRLGISLDVFLKEEEYEKININSLRRKLIVERPNKCGVFKDEEGIPLDPSPPVEKIFAALEKPCPYEIIGEGLLDGLPGRIVRSIVPKEDTPSSPVDLVVEDIRSSTWDNYHQWGGFGTLKPTPSTPGAFHTFHLHWRWGNVAGDPTPDQRFIIWAAGLGDAFGEDQFKGLFVFNHLGGPLLDSRIPNQTIKFAVSKSRPDNVTSRADNPWAATNKPSTEVFEDLFEKNQAKPRAIDNGESIVLWYSVEVKNKPVHIPNQNIQQQINPDLDFSFPPPDFSKIPTSGESPTFGGTVFIHGFYFAHEEEPSEDDDINPAAFTLGEDYVHPDTDQVWRRGAKDPDKRR